MEKVEHGLCIAWSGKSRTQDAGGKHQTVEADSAENEVFGFYFPQKIESTIEISSKENFHVQMKVFCGILLL